MIDLDVRVLTQGRRLDRIIDPRAVAWAEAQALNRTAANAQTTGLKAVSRAMGIPVSKLRKRGRGRLSGKSKKFGAVARGRKATRRRLETAVIGRGRPFNVSRWDAQPVLIGGRRRGTQHSAYGRKQLAKNTWALKNGAIVTRKGDSFRGVWGPGVAQMMERPDVVRKMEREVFARFPRHFSSAVDFAFSPGARAVRGLR